ncbi:hypothetical protein DPEC_G00034260, partial [Dallia pectoralis]
ASSICFSGVVICNVTDQLDSAVSPNLRTAQFHQTSGQSSFTKPRDRALSPNLGTAQFHQTSGQRSFTKPRDRALSPNLGTELFHQTSGQRSFTKPRDRVVVLNLCCPHRSFISLDFCSLARNILGKKYTPHLSRPVYLLHMLCHKRITD